jgi:hypothetical protein
MMATAGPKHVSCFTYFYIKHVTLDATIIYFEEYHLLRYDAA